MDGLRVNPEAAHIRRSVRLPALIGFFITLATLLITHREAVFSLWVLWSESFEYGHGLLVAPISVYLVWLRRERISACPIEPNFIGVILTAILAGLWLLSSLVGILIGEQITLVLLLIAIIHGVLGTKMARLCALPVLFLFLAIPLWSYLIPFLQATSATAATRIVRVIGVPVFNEGLYLTIPGGRFLVAEVCSGLRYLLASLTLGSLFAVMNLGTSQYRVMLFITGIALGIVFNWIRVAMIVSAGHFLGMDSLLVHKHVWLGWVLFVVVSVLLVVIGNYFQSKEEQSASQATPEIMESNADTISDAHAKVSPTNLSAIYSLLCISVLSGGAWLDMVPAQASMGALDFNLEHISIKDYQVATAKDISNGSADFQNPDAVDQKIFSTVSQSIADSKSPTINVYVAYYQQQRQGAEVVNDSNALFDNDLWERTALRPKPDLVTVNPDLVVEEFVVQRTGSRVRRLIWRFYWISGRYTSNGIDAKLKQVIGLMQGKTSAAGIVLSTSIPVSLDRSREELKDFLKMGLEPLSSYLKSLN